MGLKKWLDIKRQINKPEYFFNPGQLVRRIKYKNTSRTQVPMTIDESGQTFFVNENEVIGRSILTMGVYDLIVAESLKRLISPGQLFLDVGANIGYFSRQALRFGAQVKAFEPHPKIFEKLCNNLERFSDKAELYNSALSNETGQFSLYIPQNFGKNEGVASLEFMEGSQEVQVSTEKLDDKGIERIHLMKVDVEGHELQVFKGAEKLLSDHRIDHIIFEDFNGKQSPSIQFLQEHKYQIKRLVKTLQGPRLLDLDQMKGLPTYEPPNYIASCKPHLIDGAFKARGWKFYS